VANDSLLAVTDPAEPATGRAQLVALASITVATAVSQSFGRFTYSLLFTDIRDDLGISDTATGAIGSANLVAYLVGSLVVSVVVGRWGLSLVAQVGLAGVTVGLALLAWGQVTIVVAGALILTGFAAAGVWVTAPALATALVSPGERGRAMGIVGSGVGLGIVAASLLDIAVGEGRYRAVYAVEFLIGALATIGVLATLQRRTPTARTRLNGLAELRRVPNWVRLLIEYALFAFAMVLVMTFSVGYLEEDAGLSRGLANSAFLLIGVGTLVGGPLFGPMSDRVGRLRAQTMGLITMVVATLIIATGHPAGALVAAFAFGLSFTGGPVTIGARISDHLDGDAFGAAYGVATIAFGAGLAAGPQVGGLLADLTDSSRSALFTAAGCAAIATAITMSEGRRPSEVVE
jgi:predicted MFS family arabinose efflux permease